MYNIYSLIQGDFMQKITFNEVLLDNGQQIYDPMKWQEEWISDNT